MEAKLQRRVQRYGWDAAAPVYECGWAEQLRSAHDTLLDMAGLGPGMRVLEVACGTGLVTTRVASSVLPGGSVLATDISQEMVNETASAAAEHGFDHVETARCEAESVTAEENAFDVALCALGLMYFPEPAKALAEMRRALKPGAAALVTVWGERRNCGWAEIFPIVDAVVESEVCPLFFSLGAPDALVAAMKDAGFTGIEERRQSVELVFPTERSLLSAVIDGGAVALAAKRFSADTRREVESAFLKSVSEFRRGDGTYAVPGEFVTVRATS